MNRQLEILCMRAQEGDEWAKAEFLRLAETGYPEMQMELAWDYEHGISMPQNPQEAAKWYRRAAEQGLPDAQYHWGRCLYCGYGVRPDIEEAMKYYRMAANAGYDEAQTFIGYEDIEAKSVAWCRKAALQGDPIAQCRLAERYEFGIGVEQNLDEAKYWYMASAEQEFDAAIEVVEIMSKQPITGEEMYLNAFDYMPQSCEFIAWMRRAAAVGNNDAQSWLEHTCHNDAGAKNLVKKAKWCGLAQLKGSSIR